MGLFGGSGGIGNKQSTSNLYTTSNNFDERLVVDEGLGINAKNSKIEIFRSQTDLGAIAIAGGITSSALDVIRAGDVNDSRNLDRFLDSADTIYGKTIGFAENLYKQGAQQLQNTSAAIGSAYSQSRDSADNPNLKTINIAALAVVVIVAVAAFAYSKKR